MYDCIFYDYAEDSWRLKVSITECYIISLFGSNDLKLLFGMPAMRFLLAEIGRIQHYW